MLTDFLKARVPSFWPTLKFFSVPRLTEKVNVFPSLSLAVTTPLWALTPIIVTGTFSVAAAFLSALPAYAGRAASRAASMATLTPRIILQSTFICLQFTFMCHLLSKSRSPVHSI